MRAHARARDESDGLASGGEQGLRIGALPRLHSGGQRGATRRGCGCGESWDGRVRGADGGRAENGASDGRGAAGANVAAGTCGAATEIVGAFGAGAIASKLVVLPSWRLQLQLRPPPQLQQPRQRPMMPIAATSCWCQAADETVAVAAGGRRSAVAFGRAGCARVGDECGRDCGGLQRLLQQQLRRRRQSLWPWRLGVRVVAIAFDADCRLADFLAGRKSGGHSGGRD